MERSAEIENKIGLVAIRVTREHERIRPLQAQLGKGSVTAGVVPLACAVGEVAVPWQLRIPLQIAIQRKQLVHVPNGLAGAVVGHDVLGR